MSNYLMLTDYPIVIMMEGAYSRVNKPKREDLVRHFSEGYIKTNRIVDKKLEVQLFEFLEVEKDTLEFTEEKITVGTDDELYFIVVEPRANGITVHCVHFMLAA